MLSDNNTTQQPGSASQGGQQQSNGTGVPPTKPQPIGSDTSRKSEGNGGKKK